AEKHVNEAPADRAPKTKKTSKHEATHPGKAAQAHQVVKPENATSAPAGQKTPTQSPAQELVKHGAPNPSTACSTARLDKNGQLDCGTHGKAATSGKPDPR